MAIKADKFIEALNELVVARGISKDAILETLKEVLIKGLKRQIGFEDARVECIIDSETGVIELSQIFTVVDDVEDDVLEIHIDDARKTHPEINLGEDYYLPCDPVELQKSTAMAIKSMLKQKVVEAEKSALYEAFKDKIGTMITGKVEKIDGDRGLTVNIGKTSVFLPKTAMIGDEVFSQGDTIRLYVSDVASGTKGAHILVTRSHENFLKALFFEELPDIYDGTIEIKAIARRAGERSKVAVYSNDPNVDPAGACIGSNGSKIQKVVGQLGNGNVKEKIDIIAWSENKALFVMESLKPAHVLGVTMSEDEKSATVIVSNDSFSIAIGRRGVNVNLAVKLTRCHIDIKTEEEAIAEGIEYLTFDEVQAIEIANKANRIREAQIANLQTSETSLPGLPEDYVAPQDRTYGDEEEDEDRNEALIIESEKEEVVEVTPEVEEVVAVEEVSEEIAPVVEEVETKVEVKTTTSMEDLEKSLEDSKNKSNKSKGYSKRKKNNKKDEEEEESVSISSSVDPSTYMSIYTDEELAEMEEYDNEEEYYDDDIDYEDYEDYDELYDDDK